MIRTQLVKDNVAELASKPWMPYICLTLITLIGAALRFYKLGEWSFWIDEIYTINHATAHFNNAELILQHIPPNRNWVPTSVILTAQALNVWGTSEWSARLTSALIGTLTIPILYVPIKKIFDRRVALIAVLLLAVSPWHIFWSQNARFYTALMLIYSLALFAFHFGLERNRPQYFVVFYILFYLAMSERLIAVMLMPVIAVYLLMLWRLPLEKPVGLNLRNILILAAPVIAFLLYEIYLLAVSGDFIFASDLELLAPPIDSPIRLLIVIAFSIGIPLLCFGFFSGADLVLKKERVGLLFLIAAGLPSLLIALANPFVFVVERYAFVSLLFWIVLAASGIQTLFTLANKNGTLIALAVIFVLLADATGDSLLYYQINTGNRLKWRDAAEFVRAGMEDGDVVVSTRAPLASYYLGRDALEFQDLSSDDLESIDAPIWFIIDYPGIWHGRYHSKVWMEAHGQLLQFSYLRTNEGNSLLIYYFDPVVDDNP
ncbi:MAG: glycosyltransferase family 39 protein [Chloroflexota bacterium]|nr:glycosyltransferase family 39 protein [Chloroflexota bacterium]